jgi:arylsulfatase
MVDRMDQSIARIVEAVKQRGRLDNTIIVFLSDNGGCEELVYLPGIKRFAKPGDDTSRWGNLPGVAPGGLGTFQSYGIGWANVSNTPYRWYKSEVHEGGIATPLIVHWPKGTGDALRGKLVHTPGHVIDLMATCVEIGNAEYPETVGQHTIKPMEGVSLRGALATGVLERDAPLFFEHEGCAAIRDGQWKLVRLRGKPWELYDLAADRTETTNLASEHPDRVQRMVNQWQAWAKRADVIPPS